MHLGNWKRSRWMHFVESQINEFGQRTKFITLELKINSFIQNFFQSPNSFIQNLFQIPKCIYLEPPSIKNSSFQISSNTQMHPPRSLSKTKCITLELLQPNKFINLEALSIPKFIHLEHFQRNKCIHLEHFQRNKCIQLKHTQQMHPPRSLSTTTNAS